MTTALDFRDVAKSFTLHLRGGTVLPVVSGATFSVEPGECAVLWGRPGRASPRCCAWPTATIAAIPA